MKRLSRYPPTITGQLLRGFLTFTVYEGPTCRNGTGNRVGSGRVRYRTVGYVIRKAIVASNIDGRSIRAHQVVEFTTVSADRHVIIVFEVTTGWRKGQRFAIIGTVSKPGNTS